MGEAPTQVTAREPRSEARMKEWHIIDKRKLCLKNWQAKLQSVGEERMKGK